MDDLFLRIIKGEIPSSKVYEDADTFAFLDIRPINKGHTLVIPKTKYRNILDMDEAVLASFIRTVQKVARAVKQAANADGVNLIMNNEAPAGQDVFHAHFHVIPRFTDDHVFERPKHTAYENDGERDSVAHSIAEAID